MSGGIVLVIGIYLGNCVSVKILLVAKKQRLVWASSSQKGCGWKFMKNRTGQKMKCQVRLPGVAGVALCSCLYMAFLSVLLSILPPLPLSWADSFAYSSCMWLQWPPNYHWLHHWLCRFQHTVCERIRTDPLHLFEPGHMSHSPLPSQ